MIVITIELWPGGIKEHPRFKELGRMVIANEGGSARKCNYSVQVMKRGTKHTVLRTGTVRGYARQAYTIWKLIHLALKKAFPEW